MRKLITSENTRSNPTEGDEEEALVEIGDATALTESQGSGHSEDKRRAYNC
ncbi:albusnodin family lasso peptide [Streptomyces sp. NPDC086796]|uniref:albusnodin family lasso peptide n=1 Tax=unclassified Streptomyces TaxID=2593676 RepID=UPI00382D7EC6